jgi:hypothetical protein
MSNVAIMDASEDIKNLQIKEVLESPAGPS